MKKFTHIKNNFLYYIEKWKRDKALYAIFIFRKLEKGNN